MLDATPGGWPGTTTFWPCISRISALEIPFSRWRSTFDCTHLPPRHPTRTLYLGIQPTTPYSFHQGRDPDRAGHQAQARARAKEGRDKICRHIQGPLSCDRDVPHRMRGRAQAARRGRRRKGRSQHRRAVDPDGGRHPAQGRGREDGCPSRRRKRRGRGQSGDRH